MTGGLEYDFKAWKEMSCCTEYVGQAGISIAA